MYILDHSSGECILVISLNWEIRNLNLLLLKEFTLVWLESQKSQRYTDIELSQIVIVKQQWQLDMLRHVQLCNAMNWSPPGFSVHGILQVRILEWVAMPSFRRSSLTQGLNPCLLYLLHRQVGPLPPVPSGRQFPHCIHSISTIRKSDPYDNKRDTQGIQVKKQKINYNQYTTGSPPPM